MMSAETIRAINTETGVKAAKANKTPFVPFNRQEIEGGKISLPNLGYHVPKGWKRVEDVEWFCDSSGWGAPNEPALTQDQFLDELADYADKHPSHGYAIVETGQFQCYVGAFTKTRRKAN